MKSDPVTDTDGATFPQALAVTCGECHRRLAPDEPTVRLSGAVFCVGCGEHPDVLFWLHNQGKVLAWETECQNCGRLVRSTRLGNVAYCSPHCGQQARRNQSRFMVCPICQQRFDQVRSDAKFCSVACKQQAYRKRRKGEVIPPTTPFFGEVEALIASLAQEVSAIATRDEA